MIEVKEYSKQISNKEVLKNINYKFENGKIYGLVGRNGSGKTMLLRAIAGLIFPTQGAVYFDDKELHKDIDFPDRTGIIIEHLEMLPQYSGFVNLKILSKILNIVTDEQIDEALKKVGLYEQRDVKVKQYSMGMRQKLAIAQAIMEKPQILLLDEPTNALDDKSIEMVHNILLEVRNRNGIVIMASHNKEDINCLSDICVELRDGELIS